MNITLIDGGLGQEVFRRSGKPAHPLWSAKVMREAPEIVKAVHRDFITAGARVITLNTYTCTPSRLARDGRADWFEPLQQQAVRIAQEARKETGELGVQIAGCLPPLSGSYITEGRKPAALREEYRQIVAQQEASVDFFLIETMSSVTESKVAIEVAQATDKPIVLSLTLSDNQPDTLRSGTKLQTALRQLGVQEVEGLLFNCSHPETITQGIRTAATHLSQIRYGGYANIFRSVEAIKTDGTVRNLKKREDVDADTYADHALEWVQQEGASIIGGCCEVSPAFIARLRSRLVNVGYRPVALNAEA